MAFFKLGESWRTISKFKPTVINFKIALVSHSVSGGRIGNINKYINICDKVV